MRSVWEVVHHWPIREVARVTNLWSVPCPRGIEARGRGSRCLIGHFVYSLLCFFRWMGDGNEACARGLGEIAKMLRMFVCVRVCVKVTCKNIVMCKNTSCHICL